MDVDKIAILARIRLSDHEREELKRQLQSILSYFDKLRDLNTDAIPAASTLFEQGMVYRNDESKPSLPVDVALANAPAQENGFYLVPRVIQQS